MTIFIHSHKLKQSHFKLQEIFIWFQKRTYKMYNCLQSENFKFIMKDVSWPVNHCSEAQWPRSGVDQHCWEYPPEWHWTTDQCWQLTLLEMFGRENTISTLTTLLLPDDWIEMRELVSHVLPESWEHTSEIRLVYIWSLNQNTKHTAFKSI